MKTLDFLDHHGITRNPFAEEDAQTDPVFKEFCIVGTYHPVWDKVYGDPRDPSTSIVFGEKGAGKTAMRLQVARHLEAFAEEHPDDRLLIVHYDDFNPFLDRFRERLHGRKRRVDRALSEWKLWDHMDAILSLAVTGIVDRLLQVRQPSQAIWGEFEPSKAEELDRHEGRDLLLLAACYDQSLSETFGSRWQRLRKHLRYGTWKTWTPLVIGIATTVTVGAAAAVAAAQGHASWVRQLWWLALLLVVAGWLPWLWKAARCFKRAWLIRSHMRVGVHEWQELWRVLMRFSTSELAGQPLPSKERTDDRYELLLKLQGLLERFGYRGIIVLVDRLDEPHLINGSVERMKSFLWPMLDNKFLKHPGLGLKLMLPIELTRFLKREDREFHQRARLDKQNLVSSFEWSGEALLDVVNSRLQACSRSDAEPSLRALLDDSISEARLLEAFRQLRVPRHLFRFLYRLIVEHCTGHTDEAPSWRISAATFESTLALYLRDLATWDREGVPG